MIYDHYKVMINGAVTDFYRICRALGVTEPAIFQAMKKLARAGKAHKGFIQDVIEARDALNRLIEMAEEDKASAQRDYELQKRVDGLTGFQRDVESDKRCEPLPDDFKEVCRKIRNDVRK